jgi:hypothetical protein
MLAQSQNTILILKILLEMMLLDFWIASARQKQQILCINGSAHNNIYRIHLLRFFKWLHAPDIEPSKRPKPAVMDNIPKLKRKEKSIYTAALD